MPNRLQVSTDERHQLPGGARWVGLDSDFNSPFPVAVPGDPESHARSVEAYLRWATAPAQAWLRERVRGELRGFDLACDCPKDLPCHGDVLLTLAEGDDTDEFRIATRQAP